MANKKNIWIIAVVIIAIIIYFNIDLPPQTTITLPQCTISDDCLQPIKNECDGFFQGCSNNQCVYDTTNTICFNELVTIILQNEQLEKPKIEPIEGSKSFIFNAQFKYDSFNFGIKPFDTELDFDCDVEEGATLRFPQPSESCYITKASFIGKNYEFDNNEEVYLTQHIKLKVNKGGSVHGKDGYVSKIGLSSSFLFTITDPLSISINENMEVLHNSNKAFTLNAINNLPESEFYVKISNIAKQTNEILPETYINQVLDEGSGTLTFNADTENYGIHEVEARIFYKLTVNDEEIMLPLMQVSFNYNVVDELSGYSDVIIEEDDIDDIDDIEEEEDNNTILIILGVIIGGIILSRLL